MRSSGQRELARFVPASPQCERRKMGTAIIGLIGVLLGAAISAGTNFLLAIRRERRDREEQARIRAAELREACRLIALELTGLDRRIGEQLNKREWSHVDGTDAAIAVWKAMRSIIARNAPTKAWSDICVAFVHLDAVQYWNSKVEEISKPIPIGTDSGLEVSRDKIANGMNAISDLAYNDPDELSRDVGKS